MLAAGRPAPEAALAGQLPRCGVSSLSCSLSLEEKSGLSKLDGSGSCERQCVHTPAVGHTWV